MNYEKVIAIDDDSLAGEAIKMIFSKKGINVDFYSSPKEAIKHLELNLNDYKMAIVDYQMKELTGDKVVAKIKAMNPDIVTVVLSGDDSFETIKSCQKAGADNFYSKGHALENLALLSEAVISSSKYKDNEEEKEANANKIENVLALKGCSNELAKVAELVEKFSITNEPVLIQGASGTGKERIAKALHSQSSRKNKAFVAVNCGAIPENLLESELFGHEKGSFTGATNAKAGKFLAADGGTIFLDEVGEMPLDFQVKLLRVLQEKEVTPVGSNKTLKVNFRVVTATNRNLKAEVEKGNFREDLFYRLNILPIEIPNLKDRKADIRPIAEYIISEKNRDSNDRKILTDDALATVMGYDWPGNVRQMEGVLKRAFVLSGIKINADSIKSQILDDDPNGVIERVSLKLQTWEELEDEYVSKQRKLLEDALSLSNGVKKDAAKLLDIAYSTYLSKRVKFGLDTRTQSASKPEMMNCNN
tara:strand:+ start:104653 stop:106077 length:1425 start_codon:yes stop_codon:yes gene_type:complete